ncbi:MAG: hypothetical protein QME69_09335 [Candidatus Saccharicenans sp.]|nr:hypothetical protein [Candidatus Saccharicenans sp.]
MEQQAQSVPTQRVPGLEAVVSVGEWLITLLIASIPLVNIIMLLIWAFSGNTKLSRANWAKATLVWLLIVLAFYFFVVVLILGGIGILSRYGQ